MANEFTDIENSRRNLSEIGKYEVPHATGFKLKIKLSGGIEETRTASGLYIPKADDRVIKGADRGTVVEVGPLAGRDAGDCPENWGAVVGLDVVFRRYAGGFVDQVGADKYIFINEKDVICYIDPQETAENERRAKEKEQHARA